MLSVWKISRLSGAKTLDYPHNNRPTNKRWNTRAIHHLSFEYGTSYRHSTSSLYSRLISVASTLSIFMGKIQYCHKSFTPQNYVQTQKYGLGIGFEKYQLSYRNKKVHRKFCELLLYRVYFSRLHLCHFACFGSIFQLHFSETECQTGTYRATV